MTEISLDTTVGQLVAQRPSRARVFEDFDIDYCCGGGRSLQEACTQKGLDPNEVLTALNQADRNPTADEEPDWTGVELTRLIANILDKHHAYLRSELPRLTELVAKVHQVHGQNHPQLAELRKVYDGLRAELESHMQKEEQVLFPLIESMETTQALQSSHCGSVNNPIRVMEHEHDSAATALNRMRELTDDFTAPEDGCNTYRAMLDGLADLEADLHQHIHKENNILFPRAAELESKLCQPAGR